MITSNSKTEISIIEKLNQLNIPQHEKDLIIENGLRYRILESENELKKIMSEIARLEKKLGNRFEELERIGLPDNADYKLHENFMDLKALVYERLELKKRIETLKQLFEME